MPTLSFEGETHGELVLQVRRWLASVEGSPEGAPLSPADVVTQGAELTKEALRLIAQAAPAPVAESDLVKQLTSLGYRATDATKSALIEGLDELDHVTAGGLVNKVGEAGRKTVYQMSEVVARQMLKNLTGGK
jgi:hypothetical protein